MTGGAQHIGPSSVVVAIGDQLSSNLGGEAVILHLGRGIYFGLDDVGGRVWALVQQPRSVQELCETLGSEYEVDAERCQRSVLTLLREMAEAGLIEVTG